MQGESLGCDSIDYLTSVSTRVINQLQLVSSFFLSHLLSLVFYSFCHLNGVNFKLSFRMRQGWMDGCCLVVYGDDEDVGGGGEGGGEGGYDNIHIHIYIYIYISICILL